jgi:thiamine pyrophosphokinase
MGILRILVFAGGLLPDVDAARSLVRSEDLLICADGGARHVRTLGLVPRLIVGDLDSLNQADVEHFVSQGVPFKKYPQAKDQTDLELALSHALERDPAAIVILGALGDRLDHTLGNIALLADSRLVGRDCCLDDGVERVMLCRDRVIISGTPGDLVSLIPWGGPASEVRTAGLKWPLHGEVLLADRSRGISNVLLHQTAEVRLASGSLLVVHRRLGLSAGAG